MIAIEAAAKEKQVVSGKVTGTGNKKGFSKNRKTEPPLHTDVELAKAAGVSRQAMIDQKMLRRFTDQINTELDKRNLKGIALNSYRNKITDAVVLNDPTVMNAINTEPELYATTIVKILEANRL